MQRWIAKITLDFELIKIKGRRAEKVESPPHLLYMMSPVRVGTLPCLFRARKRDLELPEVVLICILDFHVDVLEPFAIFDFEALDAG